MLILDQFGILSFRTFRRSLFPKPVSWLELFCHFLHQDNSNINLPVLNISQKSKDPTTTIQKTVYYKTLSINIK